jgi:hypothetical protein
MKTLRERYMISCGLKTFFANRLLLLLLPGSRSRADYRAGPAAFRAASPR